MIGLGFAWASIISLPYAMLANNLPSRKMGVNIGIFNIFIVIPQLLAVSVLRHVARRGRRWRSFVRARSSAPVGWFLAGLAVLRFRSPRLHERAGSAPPAHRLPPATASMRSFEVTRRFSMTSAVGLVR